MSRRTAATYDRSRAPSNIRTAATWAKKAIRAYIRHERTRSREDFLDAEDHRHEALEHAGLVGDSGRTVKRIQGLIDPAREKAWRSK